MKSFPLDWTKSEEISWNKISTLYFILIIPYNSTLIQCIAKVTFSSNPIIAVPRDQRLHGTSLNFDRWQTNTKTKIKTCAKQVKQKMKRNNSDSYNLYKYIFIHDTNIALSIPATCISTFMFWQIFIISFINIKSICFPRGTILVCFCRF